MLRHVAALIVLSLIPSPLLAGGQETGTLEQRAAEQRVLHEKWGRFAPKGWRVLIAETGSIFGPKTNDAILVVEDTDPAKLVSNEGLGADTLNTNPRVLLFLAGRGNGYEIVGRDDGFLPSEGDTESPCLADPLMEGPGIQIKNRVISIGLNYWFSCGTWYVNQDISKFRAEKGRLRLIGQESFSFHRASGMGERTSVNFLTGRKKHIDNVADIGPEPDLEEGETLPKPVVTWSNVNRGPFYLDIMNRKLCEDYKNAPSWCRD
jgi:hypothetical protein